MPEPRPESTLDLNPSLVLEKLDSWIDGVFILLPNMILAVMVATLFIVFGSLVRRFVHSNFRSRRRKNLGAVLGSFLRWTIALFGVVVALTIVIPSLKPGDLVAGLGVGSVAIGFAFKDILQNWLAGLLILFRQPFEIGDQIIVNGYEGMAERIETRATVLRTYDGRRVIIPNSDVYTNAVTVNTAHDKRRSQYDVGIGYGDYLNDARDALLEVLNSIEGVEKTPSPEVLPWDLAASWVTLRARWWTDSSRADVVKVRAAIIEAFKHALDEADIDMPFETQVHLFHDQTEETDGDRTSQREGWPGNSSTVPRPRAIVKS